MSYSIKELRTIIKALPKEYENRTELYYKLRHDLSFKLGLTDRRGC